MKKLPDCLIQNLSKKIPTSLDWHPNFEGDLVEVVLNGPGHPPRYFTVTVRGLDDTAVGKVFSSMDEALFLYNKLTYIESFLDLVDFNNSDMNNGYPSIRKI